MSNKEMEFIDILARTIYGEARGEYTRPDGGLSALIAVANVVKNRACSPERFGKNIREVCWKPYQFSCWLPKDPNFERINTFCHKDDDLFNICYEVAENVLADKWPDLTHGSDHYYAYWLPQAPSWVKGIKPKIRIGQHIFFKLYPSH